MKATKKRQSTGKVGLFIKNNKLYILSFLLPILIMMIIFAIRKIYPFGERSFLHIDMYHQYFPFLVEFFHKLKSGGSLFYSWNTGIGSNFLALYVYYLASPFNWLVVFCPEAHLMEFITYMMVLKIGLCGWSFSYYLSKHFKTMHMSIVCFSLFYALSGYMAAYNWNVMWLDSIAIAPIIILGLERLVKEGKWKLYCFSLAFSILSNYYLSIMTCIFLVLYFIVLCIARDRTEADTSPALMFPGFRRIRQVDCKALIRFGVYSILAAGLACVLLIPEIAALRFTEFSSIDFPNKVTSYFSVIDMLARHSIGVEVETGLDHWPNIYCGVVVFLLVPLYALQKNIPLKEKMPKLCLLLFMLISYSTNMLNFIWHGLNYPDSLPARQSFLYIILMLTISFEAFLHIKEQSRSEMMRVFGCVAFFLLLCEKLITDDAFTALCFLATGVLLIIYGVLLHYYRFREKSFRGLLWITVIIVVIEAGANTFITSCPTVSRTNYLANFDDYEALTRQIQAEDADAYRIEKFKRITQNDAMLIGFPSASLFSSTSNALVKDLYDAYGMKNSRVYYCYEGSTPVSAALLATRYMFSTEERPEDDLFSQIAQSGKISLYKNKYALPFGYMIGTDTVTPSDMDSITSRHMTIDENTTSTPDMPIEVDEPMLVGEDDIFRELFSSAEDVTESMHDEDADSYEDSLTPIARQNLLASRLNVSEDIFTGIDMDSDGDKATIIVPETGHIYAYTSNTKIDTIQLSYDEESTKFKQIKKKYVLDLGYHQAGTELRLSSENGKNLDLSAYLLNTNALRTFIDNLSEQPLIIDQKSDTSITGHITVTTPGQLVLSVPYEPGWTIKIDGKKAAIDLFEDTMMSVYLDEGEHTVSLSYYPAGLNAGIAISLVSLLAVAALVFFSRKNQKKSKAS